MKDKSVGRINHAEHDHPQTAHFGSLCRKQMIATGEPLVIEEAGSPMEAAVTEPRPRKKAVAKNGPAKRRRVTAKTQPMTRGQKAAATRKRRKDAAAQAAAVDAVLDMPIPSSAEVQINDAAEPDLVVEDGTLRVRNSLGRFTRDTLIEWGTLLDNLEGAQSWLVQEGASLLEARLTTSLGGRTFVATFHPSEGWAIEVAE